jgi:hypothetical protein
VRRQSDSANYCDWSGRTVTYWLDSASGWNQDCDALKAGIAETCGRDEKLIICGIAADWNRITFVPPHDGDRDCARAKLGELSPEASAEVPSCYN